MEEAALSTTQVFKRGLVLQGGGAKGAFQYGVIRELHRAGIDFDVISGTSVGALNGALVATDSWDIGDSLWTGLTLGRAFQWTGWKAVYTILSIPTILYGGWFSKENDNLLPSWLQHLF